MILHSNPLIGMLYSIKGESALKKEMHCKEQIVNPIVVKVIREGLYIPGLKSGYINSGQKFEIALGLPDAGC